MEMCWIVQDVGILRFYFSKQKYFGTTNFCQMSQDVGKLRCLDCTSSTVISKFISDIIIRIIFVLFQQKEEEGPGSGQESKSELVAKDDNAGAEEDQGQEPPKENKDNPEEENKQPNDLDQMDTVSFSKSRRIFFFQLYN